MHKLINLIINSIAEALDPYSDLKRQAADRNWYLWNAGDYWQILDSEGQVLGSAILPTEAYLKAIYQPNRPC